jgi:acyl-CoA dehydrogenase
MGKSDPDGPTYRQQSMILVPADAPGIEVLRDLAMFGYQDRLGHGEVQFTDVRVPVSNMLGAEGDGFAIAQGRLGPGRMHYAMRAIGFAERAMSMMCRRAVEREAFGGPLADQGVVREWIARSRVEIDQARLLTLNASWLMDTKGNAAARSEVAAIKVVAMEVAHNVVNRAVQTFGAAGVSDDTVLARLWAITRALQIADGPNEVHLRTIGKLEIAGYRP